MGIESALIHRAREVGWTRGSTRSAQGEYQQVAELGPWIPARLMGRGGVAPKTRAANVSTEAGVQGAYELLLGPVDEDSNPIQAPTASSVFETDCPVLGSPTISLNGEPEILTNGADLYGFLCYGDVPLDRS
jgi:hypothetical protein